MNAWGGLVWLTITTPAEAARRVLALGLAPQVWWLVIVLTSVLSAFLSGWLETLMPSQPVTFETTEGPITYMPAPMPPLVNAAFIAVTSIVLVHLILHLGRGMGGAGTLSQAVALIAWLQVAMLVLQAGQIVTLILPPVLTLMAVVAALVVFFRAMGHFVNVLHGFDSLPRAAGVIFVSFLGLGIGLFIVLALLGVGTTGVPA